MTKRDAPDIIALPPLIALAALAISAGLEWLLPVGFLPAPGAWAAAVPGGILIVGGFGLAFWGMAAFKRAGTNIEPIKPALVLVEDGPYRFTRNPMYLGLIAVHLGIGLAASLDWSLPVSVALWLVLHQGVVLREEAYLTAKFGQPYEDYLARSRRWL